MDGWLAGCSVGLAQFMSGSRAFSAGGVWERAFVCRVGDGDDGFGGERS